MKLIDLSHTVHDGLVTYKGLPPPLICDFLSREASRQLYADGTTFQIGSIELCSNTGTYLDSPWHRYEQGKDLSELDLHSVAHLEGVKVPIGPVRERIDADAFEGIDVAGRAVLIVEHMTNLAEVPEQGFRFYAVPVKVRGMGTFPVRAFAQVG